LQGQGGKTIPIRWMPREAISDGGRASVVTKASDIWSYGVILWEMATAGDVPYGPTVSNTVSLQVVNIFMTKTMLCFKTVVLVNVFNR
jgi:serine/threonine protein kinase